MRKAWGLEQWIWWSLNLQSPRRFHPKRRKAKTIFRHLQQCELGELIKLLMSWLLLICGHFCELLFCVILKMCLIISNAFFTLTLRTLLVLLFDLIMFSIMDRLFFNLINQANVWKWRNQFIFNNLFFSFELISSG